MRIYFLNFFKLTFEGFFMKNFAKLSATGLLSIGVLTLAFPAQSAVLKQKPASTKANVQQKRQQDLTVKTPVQQPASQVAAQNAPQVAGDNGLSLTTVSYPKATTMQWIGTDINNFGANVPKPTLRLSNVSTVPTVVVPQTTANDSQIDVSVIDDFIAYASPMARHYPPVFVNRTDRYNTIQRVKQLSSWIEPYAQANNASYDVLLRATKLNAMARNLDLGSDYAVKASTYVTRAMKIQDSAEANFLYGAMLAEGGGFDEGAKYLEKAEKMGFSEATQSLAQADLLNDKKERAIQRLNDFKAKYPNDPYINEQIRLVNSGEYYIWKIPAKVVR